jgi:hypothetical protein
MAPVFMGFLFMREIIDEITGLKHFHSFECHKCQATVRYHVLQIHAVCPECSTEEKVRSFAGIGTEIQDVIDTVLEWAGDGESFDAVMKRRKEILEYRAATASEAESEE